MAYIMALDAGSTLIKAALFDQEGTVIASSERQVDTYFPKSGLVEQDPEQIYRSAVEAIKETLKKSGIDSNQVVALGIATQRINVIMWDVRTGKPIYNAMSWQDKRGPEMTPSFIKNGKIEFQIASLIAGKILWLYDKIPNLRDRTEKGSVLFGGIDTWLLWKFTDGKVHATDVSNASTTILYDLSKMNWNKQILSEINISHTIFPTVMDSSHVYGNVSTPDLNLNCPISAIVADQQASLFGHRCFYPGQAKVTFGTGSFVLANVGDSTSPPPEGIIKHAAWSFGGKATFALEGSIFSSGSALEWIVDGLELFSSIDELEQFATSVNDNNGVFFVPALTGLGSPSWDTKARGLLIGLDRGTKKGHIARAVLESLAFQVREVLDAMISSISVTQCIRIDGRPSMNDFLAQTLADTCCLNVERASNHNMTLIGAAYLAGLSTGFWSSIDQISHIAKDYRIFKPQRDMEKDYVKWKEAAERSYSWLD